MLNPALLAKDPHSDSPVASYAHHYDVSRLDRKRLEQDHTSHTPIARSFGVRMVCKGLSVQDAGGRPYAGDTGLIHLTEIARCDSIRRCNSLK